MLIVHDLGQAARNNAKPFSLLAAGQIQITHSGDP
jgi:hypothetical protein